MAAFPALPMRAQSAPLSLGDAIREALDDAGRLVREVAQGREEPPKA
jgi:class 3 adenylate cyclase